MSFRPKGVVAEALPLSFHPIVALRRQAAFAAHGGSMSISEATEITQHAASEPVATVRAETLDLAIEALASELNAPSPPTTRG